MMGSTVELQELRVFLVLADELHFGRTAERVALTPSRVSQIIRTLEHRLGSLLFERTSRSVSLTPLGERFLAEVKPAYERLQGVLVRVADLAATNLGILRVGVTVATEVPALSRLIKAFQADHPSCDITLREVDVWDPYRALREHDVDILVNWLFVEEDDLCTGPAICNYKRYLAVAVDHRLAKRTSVCVEDLADETVSKPPESFPAAIADAIFPPFTPTGRPIRRIPISRSTGEIIAQVALGKIVHPSGALPLLVRDDILLVPFEDLEPMPLGLIWLAARENTMIRDLVQLSRRMQPPLIVANSSGVKPARSEYSRARAG